MADMQELTKKLALESGYAFSLESSNSEELTTLEIRKHNFKNNNNDELINVSNLFNFRQDSFMNLNSMVKLEIDDYTIFNVKYKLFKHDIYGLALADTGNLVKGTLVSKEFWEMIGGNMSGKSNISVDTVEKGGRGLKVLEQGKTIDKEYWLKEELRGSSKSEVEEDEDETLQDYPTE